MCSLDYVILSADSLTASISLHFVCIASTYVWGSRHFVPTGGLQEVCCKGNCRGSQQCLPLLCKLWGPGGRCWDSACLHTSGSKYCFCLPVTVLFESDQSSATVQLHSSELLPFFTFISVMSKLFDIRSWNCWGHSHTLFNYHFSKRLHCFLWGSTTEQTQTLKYQNKWFLGSTVSYFSSSWLHHSRGIHKTTITYLLQSVCWFAMYVGSAGLCVLLCCRLKSWVILFCAHTLQLIWCH